MSYRTVRFRFAGSFRFGRNSLDNGDFCFAADTFFSALYVEAMKLGRQDELYDLVQGGGLLFSDAFPWQGDTLFLPKPLSAGAAERQALGSSVLKKKLKKLKYIRADDFDSYLAGTFDPLRSGDPAGSLVRQFLKVNAAVRGNEETMPYRVRLCEFSSHPGGAPSAGAASDPHGASRKTALAGAVSTPCEEPGDSAASGAAAGQVLTETGAGLFIIVKCAESRAAKLLGELLISLSFSGLGGKRSSGCGRFSFETGTVPSPLLRRLESTGGRVMSLSISLPGDDELEGALEGGSYTVVRRSGFIASENFAPQQMKKRDLYMLRSGSCFDRTFRGSIWNVACRGGSHPVFRYGKPLFMGIES